MNPSEAIRGIVREEMMGLKDGMKRVQQIGVAVADAAVVALGEELQDAGVELSEDMSRVLQQNVAKMVRVMIKDKFYRYPDWT